MSRGRTWSPIPLLPLVMSEDVEEEEAWRDETDREREFPLYSGRTAIRTETPTSTTQFVRTMHGTGDLEERQVGDRSEDDAQFDGDGQGSEGEVYYTPVEDEGPDTGSPTEEEVRDCTTSAIPVTRGHKSTLGIGYYPGQRPSIHVSEHRNLTKLVRREKSYRRHQYHGKKSWVVTEDEDDNSTVEDVSNRGEMSLQGRRQGCGIYSMANIAFESGLHSTTHSSSSFSTSRLKAIHPSLPDEEPPCFPSSSGSSSLMQRRSRKTVHFHLHDERNCNTDADEESVRLHSPLPRSQRQFPLHGGILKVKRSSMVRALVLRPEGRGIESASDRSDQIVHHDEEDEGEDGDELPLVQKLLQETAWRLRMTTSELEEEVHASSSSSRPPSSSPPSERDEAEIAGLYTESTKSYSPSSESDIENANEDTDDDKNDEEEEEIPKEAPPAPPETPDIDAYIGHIATCSRHSFYAHGLRPILRSTKDWRATHGRRTSLRDAFRHIQVSDAVEEIDPPKGENGAAHAAVVKFGVAAQALRSVTSLSEMVNQDGKVEGEVRRDSPLSITGLEYKSTETGPKNGALDASSHDRPGRRNIIGAAMTCSGRSSPHSGHPSVPLTKAEENPQSLSPRNFSRPLLIMPKTSISHRTVVEGKTASQALPIINHPPRPHHPHDSDTRSSKQNHATDLYSTSQATLLRHFDKSRHRVPSRVPRGPTPPPPPDLSCSRFSTPTSNADYNNQLPVRQRSQTPALKRKLRKWKCVLQFFRPGMSRTLCKSKRAKKTLVRYPPARSLSRSYVRSGSNGESSLDGKWEVKRVGFRGSAVIQQRGPDGGKLSG